MDAWRARFKACRDLLADDEDEDQFIMDLVMESGFKLRSPSVKKPWGGSKPGKTPNRDRSRQIMHQRMMEDYFCETPTFGPVFFRRRYRMRKSLPLNIIDKVVVRDSYFRQKVDACGLMGLSPHQKITAALRMLYYGLCADATDEYCRTSETTATESLKRFCIAIRAEFESYHLRQPTQADLEKQLAINSQRGFPGMFGSLDCMHYRWKNCPVAWQGDFGNREEKRSIILEAVADQSLHIWHIFFGLPGSNNDINVLDRSPLISNMLSGEARDTKLTVNTCEYNRYYLLTDGIYPPWSCFIQSIHMPTDEKKAYFASRQEACRKDVERCFGVLQSRFAIIQNPSRQWSMEFIVNIMFTCCILHNMILEDEAEVDGLEDLFRNIEVNPIPMHRGLGFDELLSSTAELENSGLHYGLRGDLIEHLWACKGTTLT